MQALLVNKNLVDFKKSFNFDSEKIQFRWLNIKGFDTASPISITLCSNELKWTSSRKKSTLKNWKMADVDIKMTVIFWEKHVTKNQVIVDLDEWVGNIINLEKWLFTWKQEFIRKHHN